MDDTEKFIGYTDKAGLNKKGYRTVDAGKADGATYIRYNVNNLHDKKLVANQLRKELEAMTADELIAHSQNGGINLDVRRDDVLPHVHNTMTKELLALDGANVSTHDGKRYPVSQLVVDGNGMVHGNERDYHYAQKANGKNPNSSINLLVQLANGDASLILNSAHDLLRSTKGYTDGDHPATSRYVHSTDGYLADKTTPLPVDDPIHIEMRKEALDFLQIPLKENRTNRYVVEGDPISSMRGLNAYDQGDRLAHSEFLETNELRRYQSELRHRRGIMARATRTEEGKADDRILIAYLSDKIEDLRERMDIID